ncbi:amidohydrolase [Actinocorallia sp. API 0066]|uniref:amidohydrolase family protein n=1 Tax=Actinocorallia sp. API 0066 TaxID=2896846 RepID=UPI001E291819|nr:amidohydrolase family protein [Actinocorallia sp. API 0066]MCD0449176.1 amidohydrolase [Actinocorallia sp. API 0066]
MAARDGEAREIAAFLGRTGLLGIVDVHTHFLPKRVMDKVWAYFDSVGPLTGVQWPIRYRADEDERLATLRAFGVRAFTAMVYPHKPDMAAWLNGWAADFAARTPDCLHTATFYPEPGAAAYVTQAIDAGARVFKAHLQVGAYDPRDPLLDDVWGRLAESGTPVVAHCASGPVAGEFTGPGPIGEVLRRHPRLPLIVAHLGMPEYGAFLDFAERYPEVRLDTTMAFTDFPEGSIPFPVADRPRLRALEHKILHGSDFPNIPYPYLRSLESLARLDLGDAWLRSVIHDNATTLFKL